MLTDEGCRGEDPAGPLLEGQGTVYVLVDTVVAMADRLVQVRLVQGEEGDEGEESEENGLDEPPRRVERAGHPPRGRHLVGQFSAALVLAGLHGEGLARRAVAVSDEYPGPGAKVILGEQEWWRAGAVR